MTKALVFDLDNCLADAREVGEELYQPAFDAIRLANQNDIPGDTLERAFSDIWRHPLDWVAEKYHFPQAMLAAGWQEFVRMEVSHPMSGYGDLAVLAELPVQRFLVTSGFRRLQESKIAALALAPLFTAIHIDAIDEPNRTGKLELFARILKDWRLAPSEVIVIGDNADSEIAAGNRLGICTVQTLRPGVTPTNTATFQIHSLTELKELLRDSSMA